MNASAVLPVPAAGSRSTNEARIRLDLWRLILTVVFMASTLGACLGCRQGTVSERPKGLSHGSNET